MFARAHHILMSGVAVTVSVVHSVTVWAGSVDVSVTVTVAVSMIGTVVVSVVATSEVLDAAVLCLGVGGELREEIQSFYRGAQLTRELIELRNAVQTALLVVHAASLNPTSRGCHYLVEGE